MHDIARFTTTILALSAVAPAQLIWQKLSGSSPSPQEYFGLASDLGRREVIRFGGRQAVAPTDETWAFNGLQWTLRRPATSPSPRSGAPLVYDSKRGRVLLFGGLTGNGPVAETWEWDGSDWRQITTATSPPKRAYATFAYDAARDRAVLFGGLDGGLGRYGDTWEFDGVDWQQVPGAGPSARGFSAMAYDPAAKRVVLFGGGLSKLGDTWLYDGTGWRRPNLMNEPAGRAVHSMAWDGERSRIVLVGGSGRSGTLRDLWEWDGFQWLQRASSIAITLPVNGGLAMDATRSRLVHTGPDAATWELVSLSPGSLATYGSGCRGSNGVPTLSPAPYSKPQIGGRFLLLVEGLPLTTSSVWLSGGTSPRNIDLTPLGMPGCFQLDSAEAIVALLPGQGRAGRMFLVANSASLLGGLVYLQAAAVDPGANALGVVVSNGVEVRIGI